MKILPIVWKFLKITIAGAIVFSIAFAFGVFDEQIEVPEIKADIFDFGKQTNTAKFVNSLKSLGHESPRPFDLNGNVVYFSNKRYLDDPRMIMTRYQDEFKAEGINSKRWMHTNDNSGEFLKASMSGEIVPLSIEDDYVSMGGMLTRGDIEKDEDFNKIIETAVKGPAALFRGHRFIEIKKNSNGQGSEAIAMFSGEDFDFKKMKPGYDGPGAEPDVEFPSCPGCTRLTRFADLRSDSPYRINSFQTRRSMDGTSKFYIDSMARRGWTMTETTSMFRKLKKHVGFEGDDAQQLQFSKNGEFMTVLLYPNDNGGIDVHGTITY